MARRITLYDTTLRDGSQGEGINFSLQDKLLVTRRLDELGIDLIEGGYPLSNPKDAEYFRAARELDLKHARIAAFGMTRRKGIDPSRDVGLRALVEALTPVVTVVGKSWDLHATEVLEVSLEENLAMIADSVAFLKAAAHRPELVYDAEHFFDGYRHNPDYALRTIHAAAEAGANWIVLCDTNGGALPEQVARAVAAVRAALPATVGLGIHTHNDGDLAVANTLAAVLNGADQVQGTINGIGERCGNVDLCSVIANLALKYDGFDLLQPGRLAKLTEVSRYVYEIANLNLRNGQAFVGPSAFAHKGGMHVHGVRKVASSYEHINPELVGNERRVLVSELSGKSNIAEKMKEYRLDSDPALMAKVLDTVQDLENQGWQFEAAEASFVLLVEKLAGRFRPHFECLSYRVAVVGERGAGFAPVTEATVKVKVGEVVEFTVSEGDGPVNALDSALRKALEPHFPVLAEMRLVDFKVRVINERAATAARVRVVIESRDHDALWGTIGVSENMIDASWQALVDAFEHKLAKEDRRSGLVSASTSTSTLAPLPARPAAASPAVST
ncbi:2-isopropylmalate synthase [Isosphaera pallida ATCC 43644]|jgi:2-isopropylmalate synthase|uniref:Citramalate synthase n=1 Tax=Isosphaera pallida (strain ATCC 43644 / DSM 9630 / IS1B) TaxID=575540 RepID=E8R5F1_ISOPI|nr:citramalate synthase [Isosphaera pallida]ADV60692.1 2-isopropylmalate synthase [Isosphaera pallida ATCC 43644]